MKNLIYLFIVVFLFSCKKEKEYEFSFQQPAIDDGAENVSLRPLFGPGAGGGTEPDLYTYSYYCDTVNPPEHFIVSVVGRDNIMTPKSEILKPGTKYYWKCVGSYEGQEGSSDVYSFTTIRLEELNNKWNLGYVFSVSDYEKRWQGGLGANNANAFLDKLFGHPLFFKVINDSVDLLYIYIGSTTYDNYFKGSFSFSTDTVKLIGMKYEFVNFGEFEDNDLTLTLKPFDNDTLFVYEAYY